MKYRPIAGPPAIALVRPVCDHELGAGFHDALLLASKFTCTGSFHFPWTKNIYLKGNKLYASDNRCLVEISLPCSDLGQTHFSPQDVTILRKMGDSPVCGRFAEARPALAWKDGWSYAFKADFDGAELVSRSKALLDKYWHEGRPVTQATRAAIKGIAKANRKSEVAFFSSRLLSESHHQSWHPSSIAKVIELADTYDPDSAPAPFSFRNGRGLIVNPSMGCEGLYTLGFSFIPPEQDWLTSRAALSRANYVPILMTPLR